MLLHKYITNNNVFNLIKLFPNYLSMSHFCTAISYYIST